MSNNLFTLMDSFTKLKVLIIGEAMLDRYLKGSTRRLSQEAPVQVVSIEEKEDLPGGAANTAANVRSLGAAPIFLSVIGDDEEGRMLRAALRNFDISDKHLLSCPSRQTLAKQRVLANGQMMIRFDQGSKEPLDAESEDWLIKHLRKLARRVDAIIVSDYDYGILTPGVIKALIEIQAKTPRIVVVDAKQFKPYRGLRVTAVKPNYEETCNLLHLDAKEGEERLRQIDKHGPKILDIANAQVAAITLDQDGAMIFERDQPVYRIYARPAEHNRVAGAGDTFMSALTLALAAGTQTSTAAEIASTAAAIVVEKPGTSTCYLEELKSYFGGDDKYITDNFHMAARVAAYRRQGKRIVFTNGCFDILHSGHIQYLNQAKALGDVLIVGMNTDASVQKLKGPNRPINTLEERAQVLTALSCVDHIIPFDEDIPFNLIRLIQPDVFVKGGDYTRGTLPEAELVEEQGGVVTILPYIENRSTTGIIERIRQAYLLEGAAKNIAITKRTAASKDMTSAKTKAKSKNSPVGRTRPIARGHASKPAKPGRKETKLTANEPAADEALPGLKTSDSKSKSKVPNKSAAKTETQNGSQKETVNI